MVYGVRCRVRSSVMSSVYIGLGFELLLYSLLISIEACNEGEPS